MNKDFTNDAENEPLGNTEHVFKDGIMGALVWAAIIGVVLYFIASWVSKMF